MQNRLKISALLTVSLLSGCATQSSNIFQPFQPDDLNAQVKSGQLVQKTNSFLVLNDSSSSMSRTFLNAMVYSGTKLDASKNLLNKFNKTIPAIPLTSGLRSFGFGPCVDWRKTLLNQPMQAHSSATFDSTITSLTCSSGGTPLANAISAAQADLASVTGNIALIVFSDGMDEVSPIPATEALKAAYGDRLCIYTVWVGNDNDIRGQQTLQQIANTGACGFATDVATLANPAGMSDFVSKVFFKPGVPAPQDDDQDGVINPKDKCPDTPKGAIVDKDGCWAYHGVLFDFDSDQIKAQFQPLLKNAADVMRQNPGLTVEIQGHTDSYGTDAYNQNLSERRAAAVKNDLTKRGISAARMTTKGFGESQPVESNDTDAGRAYNRRVSFVRTDK
ncbi:MAG: OmpA family protein [Methylomonas sp.]|nr:OmpA family protein [Methylomonas sp.]PPD20978.1 MAG: flagellar motor protein MotB [Methylomonas sp.]PPD27223.1 MAG: flagellar motor protein MotB [Methylomonas sp.]PPD39173.1 MAG: flagellar motor protein MotB [Methylomonas sp.]PPD41332.1 MAG: flagellar motor protein MotB [Methylomonas sp.]